MTNVGLWSSSVSLPVRKRRVESACYAIGLLLIAVGLAHLIVAVIAPRPWFGPLSWRKPVTFGVSFGTALITICWVSSYLRMASRTRATLLGILAADCVVEVSGITIQAWRQVPSHFNTSSTPNSLIAFSLAAGGVILVGTLGTFAVTAFRGRVDAPAGMRLAVQAGFALMLAGLAAGVAMIVRGEQLITSGHAGLAYSTAGYLKWFHAITLHAVLVLPALAWWQARTGRPEAAQRDTVALATGLYLLVAVAALLVCLVRA